MGFVKVTFGEGNCGLHLGRGGYSNNTDRFGTLLKRGIFVIENMVIQPLYPLSLAKSTQVRWADWIQTVSRKGYLWE